MPNGRHTYHSATSVNGYDDAMSQTSQTNHWSSTENNANNAWNVRFSDGNVNNNNNKNNSNVVRPVAATGNPVPDDFLLSVYEAYSDCKRGKSHSKQYLEYSYIAHRDIPVLAQELWNGTYLSSTSTCFLVSYPKWREVFAANFRDRIVHHWVCQYLEPLFEKRFREQGDVSFNCRKGYGTTKAVESLYDGIKRVTCNYQKEAWAYKGDLVGFFMAIDKDVMWTLMQRFISRKYNGPYKEILMRTTRTIIYHQPEKNCILNSPIENWKNLASDKSLFSNPDNKGMAIGNLTTQLFANFYLSFFDSYVQFLYRHATYHYVRFVDDFVIVCEDKALIKRNNIKIEQFLSSKLGLRLHHCKHYFQPTSHGVSFVGSVLKYGRIYLSNRTIARMMERVHGFNALSLNPINTMDMIRIQSVMNSYLGFCKGKRTYKIRKEILQSISPDLWKHFYINGRFKTLKLKSKDKPLILY